MPINTPETARDGRMVQEITFPITHAEWDSIRSDLQNNMLARADDKYRWNGPNLQEHGRIDWTDTREVIRYLNTFFAALPQPVKFISGGVGEVIEP